MAVKLDGAEGAWRELAEEVFAGVKEWRQQHPQATFAEIERAVDERWATARARLVQDLALASAATDPGGRVLAERPRCAECGGVLEGRGRQTREVRTAYERTVRLERGYAACPSCGAGLFPPG
jgi:hypothetical protein